MKITDSVSLGLKSLQRPTPDILKTIFKGVLFLSVVWSFLAPTFTEMPPDVLHKIDAWLLRGNGLVRITISFFGLNYNMDSFSNAAAPKDMEQQNK